MQTPLKRAVHGVSRWAALALFWALVFASSTVLAAAPMCGELAQTIAAPPPMMPIKEGAIRALGCDFELESRLSQGAPLPEPRPEVLLLSHDRALPSSSKIPAGPVVGRLLADKPVRVTTNAAYTLGVYRPPRPAACSVAS